MKNNDFGQKIIGLIKKDKINPKPKWQFLFKNYVIWLVGILALIFGALAFSVIIYLIKFSNWEVYDQMGNSAFEFIILTLPYFWLIFLALFIFVIYYNIKHTNRGYRYPLMLVIVVSLLGSLILGGIFFRIGWGEAIDDVLGERAPLYTQVMNHQMGFWSQPDRGRLAGVVISREDRDAITILDMSGNEWLVRTEHPSINMVEIGQPVRLLGEAVSLDSFEAELILPMGPGRGFMKRPGSHPPSRDIMDPLDFPKKHDLPRLK